MNALEKKIAFSFGAITLVFLSMTVFSLLQINQLTESSRHIQHVLDPSIKANLKVVQALNTSIISIQRWILTKEQKYTLQWQITWSVINKNYAQLKNHSKRWEREEHLDLLNEIALDLIQLKHLQQTIVTKTHTQSADATIQMLRQDLAPLEQQVVEKFRQISEPQHWEMQRTFLKEEEQERTLKDTTMMFLLLSLLGGVSLSILLARAVFTPLNQTIQLADTIARGNYDLDRTFSSGDAKLDTALRTMTNQLYEKERNNLEYQAKLELFNKQLVASNDELSQFSYRTSHDLKAPLITIRGLATAICEDIDDGDYQDVRKNASNIAGHVKKLENLVTDILNLAKAELELSNKEKINISELLGEIEARLQAVYIGNDVEIQAEVDCSVELTAPKARILQVLENLISNAIKYSDKDKPNRYVRITTMKKPHKTILTIEDNGIGIPNEYADKVFGMFQRFHPNIAYGSGLGMYIIKKHIEKMDGVIQFSSSASGTKFIIELPT
ncbi:sensor histidine kinase [Pseudoalteromonas obscura]|uniref:histidine kinase n=1 Tax=Pseudoalteromonas obscura TaxID=3048491 RepID=A0ABT7EFM8_9GAMM|nr:ATP-binding protein [Pseudoalteromonas sp. P94(2023)]MDK2594076.1 ATP-binding protein [Pseudoalteromonas sp. P94(2023)]